MIIVDFRLSGFELSLVTQHSKIATGKSALVTLIIDHDYAHDNYSDSRCADNEIHAGNEDHLIRISINASTRRQQHKRVGAPIFSSLG